MIHHLAAASEAHGSLHQSWGGLTCSGLVSCWDLQAYTPQECTNNTFSQLLPRTAMVKTAQATFYFIFFNVWLS